MHRLSGSTIKFSTKPECWPGINMLGKIVADIRDELITQQQKYTIIVVI